MDGSIAVAETETRPEYVNPVNTVDAMLFEIAQDYPDNPQVRNALAHVADQLLFDAKTFHTGQALARSGISPTFSEDNLRKLGDRQSEEIIEKILVKLGVNRTLAQIQQSPEEWINGTVSIPLDGSSEPLKRSEGVGLHYTKGVPLLNFHKVHLQDGSDYWKMSVYMPSGAFRESLDHPIANSKFPAEDISVPYLTPRSHS